VADERIAVFCPAVVHPFSLVPRFHQPGVFEPREVPRRLWLNDAKCIGQFADTGFAGGEQIKQAQPGWIGQGLKKRGRLVSRMLEHPANIYG